MTRCFLPVLALVLGGHILPSVGQEIKPHTAFPREVVESWARNGPLGGAAVFMSVDKFGELTYRIDKAGREGELPGFVYQAWTQGPVLMKPAPDRAFGLTFSGSSMTDKGLEFLVGIKHLQLLDVSDTRTSNKGMVSLGKLTSLRALNLQRCKIDDEGLKELAGLTSLECINLDKTQVTGPGMKHLARLKALKSITLSECNFTDAGLKEIAGMNSIEILNVRGTRITDRGLQELTRLKSLKHLAPGNKNITKEGLEAFKKAMPGVEIH